jgi:aminomethyltransferase
VPGRVPQSPLHAVQAEHGASFREWNGRLWADHFSDPLAEHHAVREGVGIWDISPLRVWQLRGPNAAAAADHVLTNLVRDDPPGRIRYGLMCDSAGMIVNDATVYVLPECTWIITSRDADREHLARLLPAIEPLGDELAALQIQGPRSRALLRTFCPAVAELAYFHVLTELVDVACVSCWLSRIGYSGELGYELFCAPAAAERLWRTLVAAGARPYGFAAVETLRIEAGLPLLGAEFISGRTSPYDISLERVIRLDKPDFAGRSALASMAQNPPRRLVALALDGHIVPRRGATVRHRGRPIGSVTSACDSPTLHRVIALATVAADAARTGLEVRVADRFSDVPATVRRVPLYDPRRLRPRG